MLALPRKCSEFANINSLQRLHKADANYQVALTQQQLLTHFPFQDIITKNPKMFAVFDLIRQLADTTSTVLIEGETGTGKEQVARAIHEMSWNRTGPLIAVNCAALPENLLESELFGHEKGAFTSAVGTRRGRFELANGGTLFLDEVGDLPAPMQAKLLRVLQERRFERVGGAESIEVDVRVIGASNRSLARLVSCKRRAIRFTGSTSSRSTCRRCETDQRTSRSWPPISPKNTHCLGNYPSKSPPMPCSFC